MLLLLLCLAWSEPVNVLEPTVVAALNMNYPGNHADCAAVTLDDAAHTGFATGSLAADVIHTC